MEFLLFVFVVTIISSFGLTANELCQCIKERKELMNIEKEAIKVYNDFRAGRI